MRNAAAFALVRVAVLFACSPPSPSGPPALPSTPPSSNKGIVAGKLQLFQGAGAAARVSVAWPSTLAGGSDSLARALADAAPRRALTQPRGNAVVPGEFIVRFADANVSPADALGRLATEGHRIEHKGYASEHLHLVHVEREGDQPMSAEQKQPGEARHLLARTGVVSVEENRVFFPTAIPDDEAYPAQWHYPAINLPAAWDVSQGSSSVVVAVVDSGIVRHPDLDARVLPGIDLIRDPANAQDGDGPDDDPTDEGRDLPNGASSWHGTHVAGTIGALTNNGGGVAGVDWNCRILPVRVLGKAGGTTFDIAAGIVWAAGGSVPGTRRNPNPAKVINLSLGGRSPPSRTLQDAIDFATGAGAVVVVAAGNENENTAGTSPCNQQNVICVGASRMSGARASYSNFGAEVNVLAPGGEASEDANGDGFPDGVLSTYRDNRGKPAFAFLEGTSMAAPHVAGVVALMKSVKPALVPSDAKKLLEQTANGTFKCNEGCGAGLVDAHAAVLATKGQGPTGNPKLAVSTTALSFTASGQRTVILRNTGGASMTVNIVASGAAASKLSFPSGSRYVLPPGKSANLTVELNASGLPQGTSVATVGVISDGGNATINVRIQVNTARPDKEAVLAVVYQDGQGKWRAAGGGRVLPSNGYEYEFEVDSGTYYVVAAVDENGNGEFLEPGERFGFYKDLDAVVPVEVAAGKTTSGIDFTLVPFERVASAACNPGAGPCE